MLELIWKNALLWMEAAIGMQVVVTGAKYHLQPRNFLHYNCQVERLFYLYIHVA